MAYEYEQENISKVNHFNIVTGSNNVNKPSEELKEVYRKAKAFDEILKIDNQATDEDRVTGQYESDIETVLSDYKERD